MASPFAQTLFRSATPAYATESDFKTGEGSRLYGGRWNPVGIAVIYASLSPETAMAETLAHCRYYGFPPQSAMPRTFVALHVQLSAVIDLTAGAVRQRLRVSEQRMLEADWRSEMAAGREPITQRLGRAGHAAGLEGLLVRSAADRRGMNLLVFLDNIRVSSRVEMLDTGKLPS
jgi:RES domain-containing protein